MSVDNRRVDQVRLGSRAPWTIALVAMLVALAYALTAVDGARAAAAVRSVVPVRVLIAGGARPVPLAGASVALRAAKRTVGVGRTYGRGLALIDGRIPSRFTLRTTGGFIGRRRFGGHLLLTVQHYDSGRILVVNPATTMSARLRVDGNSRTRVRADRRVRAFLKLSPGTDLGAGLIGYWQFDGRRFLKTARQHGGVARYLRLLQRDLERRPRAAYDFHGFHGSKRRAHPRLPLSLLRRHVVHGHVVSAAVQDDESWLESLVGAAGQAAKAGQLVYQLYGFLNGAPTTSEQLSSIQNQLNQVSVVLADIQGQISSLNQSLDKTEYGILNGQVSGQVSAIQDAQSSFDAVLDMANQIGCGNYTAVGGVPASCTDPQSPAQVCTAAAEAANPALMHACVSFGDLPMPGGALNFYGAPNFPLPSTNAATSLVGLFISQMTSVDQFNDADVQKIAKTFGGSLIEGTAPGADGMLQAIGQYASGNTFFTANDSQTVQDVYGFYMGVLAEGTTMRMAYDAFQGLPETSYDSSVNNMLTELHDLYVAAPKPLPAGTFIDPHKYTMWSGQIGAVENQSSYLAQVKQSSTLTLPTTNANEAPQTSAPTLAGGATISNWAAAQQADLQALTANIKPGSSTIGDYLTGLTGDGPGAWPGLLTGALWDGRANAFGGNYAAESAQTPGFAFHQTNDEAYFDDTHGYLHDQIPVLLPTSCVLATSGCQEPVWSNGSAPTMFDLHNGGDPAQVYLHGGDVTRKNGLTSVQGFDNWTGDQRYCVKRGIFDITCTEHRTYSGVTNHLTLPVLFERTPTNTATECYYWPAVGDDAQGNGCPTGPPSP